MGRLARKQHAPLDSMSRIERLWQRNFACRRGGGGGGGGIDTTEITRQAWLARRRSTSACGYTFYPFYSEYHDGYGICERAALCSTRLTTAPARTKADIGHAAAERTHLGSRMGRVEDASGCNPLFPCFHLFEESATPYRLPCSPRPAPSARSTGLRQSVAPGPEGHGLVDSAEQSCDRRHATGARGNHPRD
jgi:hypothetical protein